MPTLFVEKSIEIHAPAQKVWEVLTTREYTGAWAPVFGMPDGYIDSTWTVGSPVLWKDGEEKVVVTGEVVSSDVPKRLHYTVVDAALGAAEDMDEHDGITFELHENGSTTTLKVVHGDFAKMPDGQKYYGMTVPIWDKVLPCMKELAESASELKA